MREVAESRQLLALRVERTALIGRYVAYFLIAPFFLTGMLQGSVRSMLVLTGLVVAHNLYAHWLLLAERDDLCRGPLNLSIYLLECSILVYYAGPEQSVAFTAYLLLIIGFTAHSRKYTHILGVTLASCACYALVILLEFWVAGIELAPGEIGVRFIIIGITGWLAARIGEQLWIFEQSHIDQAQALASSEALLRTTLNTAADPILVFDENELISEANEHACVFLGVSHHDLLGQRIRSFLFDDGTLPTKIAALRARGETVSEEIVINADDEERQIELMIRSFLRDGQRFYVAVMHDITEHKQLQEATRRANAHLEHLNQELRQLDELRTGFLATMSQRVRSPLSAILGYIEMLLGEELGEISYEQQRALQTCRKSVLRIFGLVDEAQDLGKPSKAETDPAPAVPALDDPPPPATNR